MMKTALGRTWTTPDPLITHVLRRAEMMANNRLEGPMGIEQQVLFATMKTRSTVIPKTNSRPDRKKPHQLPKQVTQKRQVHHTLSIQLNQSGSHLHLRKTPDMRRETPPTLMRRDRRQAISRPMRNTLFSQPVESFTPSLRPMGHF